MTDNTKLNVRPRRRRGRRRLDFGRAVSVSAQATVENPKNIRYMQTFAKGASDALFRQDLKSLLLNGCGLFLSSLVFVAENKSRL
jgi:hypothetical protein